ncbi:MAG: sulfatase-like hydrolase/transferase, partial [Chloroflexi bacterium]|nr:sulfatase-like hydrolase/transferase [Chloroflexota bacterium]
EQVGALLGAIEEGKGFVGIHGATATFWNAPVYLVMLGSRFLRHDPFKTFTVTVDDRTHPITAGIEDFEIGDELYEQGGNVAEFAVLAAELAKGRPSRELRRLGEGPLGPDIHVLASAEGHPLLYVKSFGKGRVHYNALGHDARAINHPTFQRLVLQAIDWAHGRSLDPLARRTAMSGRPMNVLLVWTDEQRADSLGVYGNPRIRTPNVDCLADRGILFEQAYCTQPVCSPSRASILTGLYPHTHGATQKDMVLGADTPTLAELLRPAGYACGYVGKWHLGHEVRPQHGFEQFWISTEDMYTKDLTAEGYSSYHAFLVERGYAPPDKWHGGRIFNRDTAARLPEEVGKPAFQAAECIRFLETYRDQPFFLSVNFLEPHFPYFGPWDGVYRTEAVRLPVSWYREMEETVPFRYRVLRQMFVEDNPWVQPNNEAGWRDLTARYWGLCSLVDKHVGRVLDRLEALGLAEDTIVVYTSEHGDMLGEHRMIMKCVPYEGAVRVPLIIRAPGLPARRIATPVSQVDLVPTLLDLLDLPVPGHVQGTSLVPLLTDGDIAPDDATVVVEWSGLEGLPGWGGYWARLPRTGPLRSLTADQLGPVDWRSIRRGPWKLNVHLTGEHELYSLREDPGELHNAIRDPGREGIVRSLYGRLRRWQHEVHDTLVLPELPGRAFIT